MHPTIGRKSYVIAYVNDSCNLSSWLHSPERYKLGLATLPDSCGQLSASDKTIGAPHFASTLAVDTSRNDSQPNQTRSFDFFPSVLQHCEQNQGAS